MKYLILIAVVLFCLTSAAASVELKDVITYSLPQDQSERVVLEMKIGQDELLSPSIVDQLYNKEIYAVDYVYTKFADPSFNQGQLNKDRMARIMEVLPQVKMPDVRWSVIRQTECIDSECASQALHGFVISYRSKNLLTKGILDKQFFIVDSESSSTRVGKNGTVLRFPEDAFVDGYNRPVTGEVNFILREAICPKNFVKAGLATQTVEGEILQTGGMVKLQAYQNGRNLSLASGKYINIEVPIAEAMDGMQFYKGALDRGELRWTEPTEIEVVEQSRPNSSSGSEVTGSGFEITGYYYEYSGKLNRAGRLISSVNWERNSDTLTVIRANIDGENVALNRNDAYLERGLEIGLDSAQTFIVQQWFDMDTAVILLSEVDAFLGVKKIGINDILSTRNLLVPVVS